MQKGNRSQLSASQEISQMRSHKIKNNAFIRGLAIVFAAIALISSVAAQDKDKVAKANLILEEGRILAEKETPESWKAAEGKFTEARDLFVEAVPPQSKNDILVEFANYLRKQGNAFVTDKRFTVGERYIQFALGTVRTAGIRGAVAILTADLGNSAVLQGKTPIATSYYKEALVIYLEVKNFDQAGFINRQFGLISYNENKFTEALVFLKEALKQYRVAGNRERILITLIDIGDTYVAKQNAPASKPYYKESLDLSIALKDGQSEAKSNAGLGLAAYHSYQPAEAVKHLEAAQVYFDKAGKQDDIARNLLRLGKAYLVLPDNDMARTFLRRAAAGFEKIGDAENLADALFNLSSSDLALGDVESTKRNLEKAIAIFTEYKNEYGLSISRVFLADAFSYENDFDKALEQVLIGKALAEKSRDAGVLNSALRTLGWIYASLSRYDEAFKAMDAALKLAEESGDKWRQADTLVNIGVTNSRLGLTKLAIEQYAKALELARISKNTTSEAVCLNNIGYNSYVLGDLKKAREYLEKAIVMMRPLKMRREEGYALHNLGMVYLDLKDYKSARSNYEQALQIYLVAKDRRVEAYAYMSLGEVDALEEKWDSSVDNLEKAILLARETKYSDVEGNALALMMEVWESRKQPRLAILYGKQAVNLFQTVRSENKGLQKNALAAYVKQNETSYRTLADILVSVGRLPEAQQVLDLLKAEEYLEFVRRDAGEAANQSKLALTDTERKALDEYTRLSSQLTSLGSRFQVLQDARVKADGKLADTDEVEFQKLKTQIEEAGVGIRIFLSKLASEFSKTVEDQTTITPDSIATLRADLRRAGPDVVLVSTYLLPERYRAIVTTGRTMVDRKVEYSDRKLTVADINRKISEFRRALQDTKTDPRPLGKELYDIFVKPLEGDLKGAGAKTILWSLDGTLRYIPIAALSPDGKTYMAEHYQNVVVTLARQTNLFTKPSGDEWRALGAGVSKPHEGFSPLPSVINEINSIVKENGSSGVLNGKKLVDEKFNLDAFRNAVPQQTDGGKVFNVVHLATHFKLGINDRDSALLLGDGKQLSLFDISKDESLDFKDVELLALSACETGVAAGDQTGREVESLGMLAQKKGAKSVLATLWKVADEGTSMFMSEFYRNKQTNPRISKAEAIRLAQKAMIDGKIKSTGIGGGCRAELNPGTGQKPFKCDPNAPFSHPYFWSPFVLIGNWR